jgi:hypothetical protein
MNHRRQRKIVPLELFPFSAETDKVFTTKNICVSSMHEVGVACVQMLAGLWK